MKILLIVLSLVASATSIQEEVRLTIRKHLAEIQKCSGDGKVVVDFEIDDKGSVTTASANPTRTTLKDPSCIIDTLKTWKFPPAKSGETTRVSYPFVFTRLK